MRFRKKPVVIHAVQFLGDPKGMRVCECQIDKDEQPHCHALEGILRVSHGDWIITGVKGEVYPCKPDIFEATYERVGED